MWSLDNSFRALYISTVHALLIKKKKHFCVEENVCEPFGFTGISAQIAYKIWLDLQLKPIIYYQTETCFCLRV